MKNENDFFRGREVKLRIKNLTGGYVLVLKDGTVVFDLYPDEEDQRRQGPACAEDAADAPYPD